MAKKSDHPPLHMIVDRGRLVPATSYDQERLDSYRNGTAVKVIITAEKDRPMVRKWWAVIGAVMKHCETPFSDKDQASEAIKLELNIVNVCKSVNGTWMRYPKSLTELDDPDLDDAVIRMMDLLYQMTGVDPEALNKETAAAGDMPVAQEPSAASSSQADVASPDISLPASGEAPNQQALIDYARAMWAVRAMSRETFLNQHEGQKVDIKAAGEATVARARKIFETIKGCRDEGQMYPKERTYIAGLIGLDEREIWR